MKKNQNADSEPPNSDLQSLRPTELGLGPFGWSACLTYETDRHTDREKQTHTHTQRKTERHKKRQRDTDRQSV